MRLAAESNETAQKVDLRAAPGASGAAGGVGLAVKADRALESGSIDTESQQDGVEGRVQRRLELRAAEERVQAGLAFLNSRRSSGDGDSAEDGSNRDDREAHFGCLVFCCWVLPKLSRTKVGSWKEGKY